ncbi:MAG: toxin-antitoxin system HicB family antitoxin [Deltaproteobacteria bacterium]|jgi:predicted HicB family RNase H-like nuclease|nr:toxin-antitoxin system HicB family antitoxin [Deltaproteobacteria bacterium]
MSLSENTEVICLSSVYSEDGGCFVGEVAGLGRHGISFEGETEEEIRKDFESAIGFYLETEPQPEKPCAGFLTVQIPPEIHEEICSKAQSSGDSLDMWFVKEISGSVSQHA